MANFGQSSDDLYYLVGEYAGNGSSTENFGEIFFETANKPFAVYISSCNFSENVL